LTILRDKLSIPGGKFLVKVRTRGEKIRNYILEHVEHHPADIAKHSAEHFTISRQAVNKHLGHLVEERALIQEGHTRNKIYKLCPQVEWEKFYELTPSLEEDVVWRQDIAPLLGQLPENVVDIWRYGFTEMFNNAIDHSGAERIRVEVTKTAASTEIFIYDNGVGIFKKIQQALNLLDERHAVLELSKGKLTTDPERHTGEGIFFASRMFDSFRILSADTFFSHQHGDDEDWVMQNQRTARGTSVFMRLNNHTSRTTHKIFSEFQSGEDIGFTKTVVPVRLAQYGDDKLVSRSQAKRLLDRVDRFKTVLLDFTGVTSIGQAFADEIFRVFRKGHPAMILHAIHTTPEVQAVIDRAEVATG
jgi:anti-sigma regulatory factor (Ser/Thr protein kinase)